MHHHNSPMDEDFVKVQVKVDISLITKKHITVPHV